MKQIFLRLAFPLAVFLSGMTGFTQDSNNDKEKVEWLDGMLALQVGVPVGGMQEAIKNKMGNLGAGAGIAVLFNPLTWGKTKRNSPVWIGTELGYTYYGRFLSEVEIGGYKGDYKTSYGVLQLNGLLHFRSKLPAVINPFFEILFGGSFYLSSINENLDLIESSLGLEPFNLDNYSSASFNKGLALGLRFNRSKADEGSFKIRLSYNRGNTIRYVERNSLAYNSSNGRLEYEIGKAPVHYFLVQVGFGN